MKLKECQCSTPGFCKVNRMEMPDPLWRKCQHDAAFRTTFAGMNNKTLWQRFLKYFFRRSRLVLPMRTPAFVACRHRGNEVYSKHYWCSSLLFRHNDLVTYEQCESCPAADVPNSVLGPWRRSVRFVVSFFRRQPLLKLGTAMLGSTNESQPGTALIASAAIPGHPGPCCGGERDQITDAFRRM
jgi:hypothetical protein